MASVVLRPALVAAGILVAGLTGIPGAALAQAPSASGGQAATPAPSPAHLAAARELMNATNVLGPLDELVPSFGEQIKKQNVTRPEMTKDLDAVIGTLGPEMQLQRQRVTDIVARTYAKYLTESELKELATFFRTPLGQKYNRLQPDLVEEVVTDVGAWTQETSEYVMVRVRAEMQKRGHALQ